MEQSIIRLYEPKDYDAVCALMSELQTHFAQVDTMGESRQFSSGEEAKQYVDQGLKDIREMNGVCFVAERNRMVIGFVQGIIDMHEGQVMHVLGHNDSIDGWIGLLIVTKKFRNQRVGKQLMENMKTYFQTNSCATVRLKVMSDNVSSLRMYESLGFKAKEIEMVLSL